MNENASAYLRNEIAQHRARLLAGLQANWIIARDSDNYADSGESK